MDAKETAKMEPLKVAIYNGDECLKIEEIPDPREFYIDFFNEQAERYGYHAAPA
jgi:hypothetical protein